MSSLDELARSIDVGAAEPYLRLRGWELAREGQLGNRWRLRCDDGTRNIAVPHRDLDVEDRRHMFVAVLSVLAEVERREPGVIARDLREAAYDLVEFRLVAAALSAGEMPLHAAPELTRGALEAFQAAARAEISPRPHYAQGQLPAEAKSFVNDAVMARPEPGSVILRIRAPLAPELSQTQIAGLSANEMSGVEGFDRRVLKRLVEGVRAAKVAVHRDPTTFDDEVDEDIEEGLSANLCDALVKLSGAKSDIKAKIELRVRWALTQPSSFLDAEVLVERGEIGQLPRIAKALKQIQPLPGATVQGPVVQVRHLPGDEAAIVVINAFVQGRERQVRMELHAPDWRTAAEAQIAEAEIRATGTLERAGTTRELTSPTAIKRV